MNARYLIGALALVVATLLVWQLRWVLLVLFGAVVLAVALDVPITWPRWRWCWRWWWGWADSSPPCCSRK